MKIPQALFVFFAVVAPPFSALSSWAVTVDDVDPFIGTGFDGSTYPAAQAPFGMLSWGPSNTFDDYASVESRPGYLYTKNDIWCFTATHISGVGCHAAQDLPIMPFRGAPGESPALDRDLYASHFDKETEKASPGFYEVALTDIKTKVSLAAGPRAGIGQFEFSGTEERGLLFRPTQSANGVTAAELQIDSAQNRVTGMIRSGGFCDPNPEHYNYTLFYVIEFDQSFAESGFWKGSERREGGGAVSGLDIAGYVIFGGDADEAVQARIGLSYVSLDNAIENLRAEVPAWDFTRRLDETQEQWNEILSQFSVDAPRPMVRQLATAIYHNCLQPSIFEDVNGEYLGFDDEVYLVEPGRHKYVNFSNWDTYRTSAQLQGMLYPKIASDMAESMRLDDAQGAPAGFPIWGLFNNETWVMNGYSGVPWIVNAFMFGATDFDQQVMLDAMLEAVEENYMAGDQYRDLGYIAIDPRYDIFPVSRTLECAIDDFALAQMCKVLGDEKNAARLFERSQNSFNFFDPSTRFLRPRYADGSWLEDFSTDGLFGFNEGNSWHYTWSIPHNIKKLFSLIGTEEEVEARIDQFFSKLMLTGWHISEPFFWLSNEPCFGTPFLYYWLGKPWKTQALLPKIMVAFDDTPRGLPGDDDVGAMSAYMFWLCMGLYPAIPGTPGFLLSAPKIDQATLHVGDEKTITVTVQRENPEAVHIQEVMLNGRSWSSTWMPLDALLERKENDLKFILGAEPNLEWGRAESDRPPSFEPPVAECED